MYPSILVSCLRTTWSNLTKFESSLYDLVRKHVYKDQIFDALADFVEMKNVFVIREGNLEDLLSCR